MVQSSLETVPHREGRKIRLLIADTSRIHTELLSDALGSDSGLNVVSWNSDLLSLLPTARSRNVDVLAISSAFQIGTSDAFEIVRQLRSLSPETKAVVLLDSQNDEDVITAFQAGARGIFNRDGSVEMFRRCIRAVHGGEIWASARAMSLAIDALASMPRVRTTGKGAFNVISKRESEVVQYLVQGLTNREIADKLRLSQHTIKNHLFRIFDKLGVSNRTELLFLMLENSGSSEDRLIREVIKKAL